jgi:hypothetical protein
VLDGEPVIWDGALLDFDLLRRHLVNRGSW